MSSKLSSLNDKSVYSSHFMDLTLWEPYVREVCLPHGIVPHTVRPGVPGTFPTFIVEPDNVQPEFEKVVVKFFGPPYNGLDSFHVERNLGHWLEQLCLFIRSPAILSHGQLDQDWWYLIFEYIPGIPIRQVRDQLSMDQWVAIAEQLGEYLKKLHTADSSAILSAIQVPIIQPTWKGFADFLSRQRNNCLANHKAWDELPAHLVCQIEDFVLPVEQLIDFAASPHLIHADLTPDHLLGSFENSEWQTSAIIDWGDAMTGNILYELVALYLDLLHSDKHLLRIFIESYGLPEFFQHNFPRHALSMTLLHQFPMPSSFYAPYKEAGSLQELAECLFI